jgi:hypothetical protein
LKRFEYDLPVTLLCPVRKSVVDRLPGAEALGQVSPGHACFRTEKHGFDEQPISSRCPWASFLFRQDRLQSSPLIFGQRMSVHGNF